MLRSSAIHIYIIYISYDRALWVVTLKKKEKRDEERRDGYHYYKCFARCRVCRVKKPLLWCRTALKQERIIFSLVEICVCSSHRRREGTWALVLSKILRTKY